jgi:hypothetical protein
VIKRVIITDSQTHESTIVTNSTLFDALYKRIYVIQKEVKTFVTNDEIVNQFYSVKNDTNSKIANILTSVSTNEIILEWVG